MTMKRRGAMMIGLGRALIVGLLGFAVTPAQALSISGTYSDIAFGSAGTGGPVLGLQTAPVGPMLATASPSGSTNFWSVPQRSAISPHGFGTGADDPTGRALPAGLPTDALAQR